MGFVTIEILTHRFGIEWLLKIRLSRPNIRVVTSPKSHKVDIRSVSETKILETQVMIPPSIHFFYVASMAG